ncbi:MAG: TadG family pilus assembly protein [Myxococcota bacterium]
MHSSQRGSIALKTAVMMPVFGVVAAIGVDLAHALSVSQDIRSIADAAALSGASALGTQPSEVRSRAIALVGMHRPDGHSLTLHESDVEIGDWNPDSATFKPNEAGGNAVRVRLTLHMPTTFARLFGLSTIPTGGTAIASVAPAVQPQTGGPCSIYAGAGVKIEGQSRVDAYDSSLQSYQGQNVATASICSATDALIQNQAEVWTDISTFDGLFLQDLGRFFGQARSLEKAPPLFDVDWADVRKNNTNLQARCPACAQGPYKGTAPEEPDDVEEGSGHWVVDLSGSEVLTLPPGRYSFDKLVSAGTSRIVVPGPGLTEIYVEKNLSSTGEGFINQLRDPKLLRVYVKGTQVYQSGDTDFHGSIYAPHGKIDLTGQAHFYGAALAGLEVVFGGNMGVHIDVALDPWLGSLPTPGQRSGMTFRLVQ